jgi:gliding motility-associated-like protein
MLAVTLCMAGFIRAAAQCSGSPIFLETFGGSASSPEVGPPLPSSVTSYQYVSQGDIQDGQYSIKKTTGPMFNWFANGKDHTGNGYMMIVNASYDPGKFYERKIDGLCAGSTFYFSAWIANLLPKDQYGRTPLDPAVRFLIRSAVTGDTLAQYATGTIPRYDVFTWTQYGMPFTLPAGETSLILTIFNDNPGGMGNDLALDDIAFTICGPPIQTFITGTYQDNGRYACVHDAVALHADPQNGYYHRPQYQWQFSRDQQQWNDIPGATDTVLAISDVQPTDSGWYRLLIAEQGNIGSPHCRVASSPLALFVEHPDPTTLIQTHSPLCEHQTLSLSSTQSALTYTWLLPDGSIRTDSSLLFTDARPTLSGHYALKVVTRGGCRVQADTLVEVQPNELHVNLGKDTLLCNQDSLLLNAANPGAVYRWNTGATDSAIWVKTAGTYQVTVAQGACEVSDSIHIEHLNQPAVDLVSDTTACLGDTFSLNAYSPLATTYRWQDGSDSIRRTISESGVYIVSLSNACGTTRDTVNVQFISCAPELLVPNAFTPNDDGVNDRFRPRQTFALRSFSMTIFDRWGNAVFHTHDPLAGWDGTLNGHPAPMGTYVWYIVYQKQNGKTYQAKGTVLLIR